MPFDVPDSVVEAFLDRVPRLSAGDRTLLDNRVRDYFPVLPPHRAVAVWWLNLMMSLRVYRVARKSLIGCRDQAARARYLAFYKRLVMDGWPDPAIARVAQALAAVRLRDQGVTAELLFDRSIGQVLSRHAIGWTP